MRDAHDVAYDQSARVASTNPAGDRPLALRRDRAEAVFDLKLESARAADGSALQTGSGQVNIGPALGVGKRLDDRPVRSGFASAPDQCRDHRPVTKGSLEFERFAKLLVVVCGGIELCEPAPQGLVFRGQPLVLSPQAGNVSEHRGGAPGGRGE